MNRLPESNKQDPAFLSSRQRVSTGGGAILPRLRRTFIFGALLLIGSPSLAANMVTEYDVPYDGKYNIPPEPVLDCRIPIYGKDGDILYHNWLHSDCYTIQEDGPDAPEPPVTCSDNQYWQPGIQIALGTKPKEKQCS